MKRFVLENAGHGLVRPAGRGRGGRAEVVACVWVSTGGGLHRAGVREPKETGLGDGGGHLGSIRGGMERCVGLSPSKLRPKEKGVMSHRSLSLRMASVLRVKRSLGRFKQG